MKPSSPHSRQTAQREITPVTESQFFFFKADTDMWTTWHYHPEIDILLTLKNTGFHITGDHMGDLRPGTLILNGPNVPHAFHPNEADEGNPEKPAMLVIQFSEDSLGKSFLSKLEMNRIRTFLHGAKRSYEFFGHTRQHVATLMHEMLPQSDAQRFASFILILDTMANAPDSERAPLVSPIYAPTLNAKNVQRIDTIKNWITQNLDRPIRLEEVARQARMSPKSFSRFFKKNTGKSFIQYLNELRVGLACQKLMQTDANVSEICYACGFNNLSNFNRRFREIKNHSPRAYRAQLNRQ